MSAEKKNFSSQSSKRRWTEGHLWYSSCQQKQHPYVITQGNILLGKHMESDEMFKMSYNWCFIKKKKILKQLFRLYQQKDIDILSYGQKCEENQSCFPL